MFLHSFRQRADFLHKFEWLSNVYSDGRNLRGLCFYLLRTVCKDTLLVYLRLFNSRGVWARGVFRNQTGGETGIEGGGGGTKQKL